MSSIEQLMRHAEHVQAHAALHANYSPSSSRAPQPDWSVHVLWIISDAEGNTEPASIYGTGADLDEACAAALNNLHPGAPQ